MSCTSSVEITPPFLLDGRNVRLIDTPGFDDTNVSDADVLKDIAAYLRVMLVKDPCNRHFTHIKSRYEEGYKLSGIIYLHRISDVRVGGIARKNFSMFRKLCGDETLKNVIIATTRWDSVDISVGEARERQLTTAKEFFQPALAKGAHLVRVSNTSSDTVHAILHAILGQTPRPVLIQREMVEQGRDITRTSAGQELISVGSAEVGRLQSQLAQLTADIRAAGEEGDDETREELEEDRHGLVSRIESNRVDPEKMRGQYEETVEDLRRKLKELRGALKEEQLANSRSRAAREELEDREKIKMEELRRVAAVEARKAAEAERKAARGGRKATGAWKQRRELEKALRAAEEAREAAEEGQKAAKKAQKAAEKAQKNAEESKKATEEEYRKREQDLQRKNAGSCTIF